MVPKRVLWPFTAPAHWFFFSRGQHLIPTETPHWCPPHFLKIWTVHLEIWKVVAKKLVRGYQNFQNGTFSFMVLGAWIMFPVTNPDFKTFDSYWVATYSQFQIVLEAENRTLEGTLSIRACKRILFALLTHSRLNDNTTDQKSEVNIEDHATNLCFWIGARWF